MTNRRSREFSLFLPVTVLPAQKTLEVPLCPDSTTSDAIAFCTESLKLMATSSSSSYTLVGDFGGFEKHFEPEERLYNLVRKQIVTASDNVKFFLRRKKAKPTEPVETSVASEQLPGDTESKNSSAEDILKFRHISSLVQSILLDENSNDLSYGSPAKNDISPDSSDHRSEAKSRETPVQLDNVDEPTVKIAQPNICGGGSDNRGPPVMPTNFEDLCEVVEQQKRRIGANNSAIDVKESKLRALKQSEAATTHKALSERLKVLRDRVSGEEAQLGRLKQLRSDLEWERKVAVQSDAELLVLRQELLAKEEQLQRAAEKVSELSRQLTEVRKLPHGKRLESESESLQKFTKLREELAQRKKMNADGLSRLKEQLSLLSRRQSELMAIDQRVGQLSQRVSEQRCASESRSDGNSLPSVSRSIGRLTPIESHLRTLDRLTVVSPTPPVMPPPPITTFPRWNDTVVDQKPRASVGPFKPTVAESSSSGDESPLNKPDTFDPNDITWVTTKSGSSAKISSMERLGSPLTVAVQNAQSEVPKVDGKDVKTTGFKTAFMAMQETLEDVGKPKSTAKAPAVTSVTQYSGLTSSLRVSAPLAQAESSDAQNSSGSVASSESDLAASTSRTTAASTAVHLFTQAPLTSIRLSPNSGAEVSKPNKLPSPPDGTATSNGVTNRLSSKEITNVYTRVDPPHIPTALADYKRRIQRMKEESKLGMKGSISAGNMDAYRNVLPQIYSKPSRLETTGDGKSEPIKTDLNQQHSNPPDLIPPEDLGVHLRQNPIDLRSGEQTKAQLFYSNMTSSARVPEPDVLHIRADTLRAAKRRSWAAAEHSNNSANSEADSIRWLLHQEQLKGRTNVNLSELFAKLSNKPASPTTATPPSLPESSVPSARRGSYRSATDDKSDLLAPIELSESVRNEQSGRVDGSWNANTQELSDQQEMTERQEESPIPDEEGFMEFIPVDNQPVTCVDTTARKGPSPTDQATHIDIDPDRPDDQMAVVFPPATKGILKPRDAESKGIRIRFDPMALLLDASLEGELELVKTSAMQVKNVSASNDEGITALHNAICAGHYEIVRFLVESDADVNAQDSDGWTPLHCAASCNNLPMVKFLVENGGCIFATTISDHETPADKCEEDEDGFDGCSQFLISIQDKLGIMNGGRVFGAYDFEPSQSDELKMTDGDELLVLKRDESSGQRGWWVAKNLKTGVEGLVPRNYLALYARRSAQKRHAIRTTSNDDLIESQTLKRESPIPLKQHLIEGLECFEETAS